MSDDLADRIVQWLVDEANEDKLTPAQLERLHEVFGDAGLPVEVDAAYARQTATTVKVKIVSLDEVDVK